MVTKGEIMSACVCVCVCSVVSTLCNPMDYSPPGSAVCGMFQGRNTGAGCCFLLQGIFLNQRLNPHLCISCIGKWILYH